MKNILFFLLLCIITIPKGSSGQSDEMPNVGEIISIDSIHFVWRLPIFTVTKKAIFGDYRVVTIENDKKATLHLQAEMMARFKIDLDNDHVADTAIVSEYRFQKVGEVYYFSPIPWLYAYGHPKGVVFSCKNDTFQYNGGLMTITLQATKREGTTAQIRANELVPAVYYGAGSDAVSISVPMKDFIKAFKDAGETTTIALQIGGEKINTLVHDIQRDPISGAPTHVDFLVIDMNKEIEVSVPIEFTGLADAEKNGIGTIVKVVHEINVKALPANLPHSFVVDITRLATLEDQIHVKDIELGTGVTLVDNADDVVALVTPFIEEKEEVSAPIDLDSIEVEKKGKDETVEEPAAE